MSFLFVSHRSVDKPRIRPFLRDLIRRNIPVWIDNFEELNLNLGPLEPRIELEQLAGGIEKARDWPLQIDQALVRAFAIVVFWSRNWSEEREILVREHGLAHVFGNTGLATYIPVFLDSPAELPAPVSAYRAAVHDVVQGYDVARYGEPQWQALVEHIERLWDKSRQQLAPAPAPAVPVEAVDWHEVIRDGKHVSKRIIELLRRLPEGPAVPAYWISYELQLAFASNVPHGDAPLLVMEADGLVLQTYPESARKKPHTLVVVPAAMPPPKANAIEFWTGVFPLACILGPRMVGGLLLCIRPQALRGLEHEAADLLKQLENM